MFSRRQRLSRAAFPRAVKTGRRVSSPHFSAVVSSEARGYAVVIPKKVARLAVVRHKMKRRTLSALRTLSLPPALILFPKSTVADMPYQEVQKEIAMLLSKIRE